MSTEDVYASLRSIPSEDVPLAVVKQRQQSRDISHDINSNNISHKPSHDISHSHNNNNLLLAPPSRHLEHALVFLRGRLHSSFTPALIHLQSRYIPHLKDLERKLDGHRRVRWLRQVERITHLPSVYVVLAGSVLVALLVRWMFRIAAAVLADVVAVAYPAAKTLDLLRRVGWPQEKSGDRLRNVTSLTAEMSSWEELDDDDAAAHTPRQADFTEEPSIAEETTRWSTYWLLYAMVKFIAYARAVLPHFHVMKSAFLLWAMHPNTKGALLIYRRVLLRGLRNKAESEMARAVKNLFESSSSLASSSSSGSLLSRTSRVHQVFSDAHRPRESLADSREALLPVISLTNPSIFGSLPVLRESALDLPEVDDGLLHSRSRVSTMSDTTSSQIYDDPSTDDDELVREAPYAAAAPYLIATTPEPSLSLNTGLHTPSPKKITSMYGNSVLLRNSPIREAVLKTAGTRSRDASSAE